MRIPAGFLISSRTSFSTDTRQKAKNAKWRNIDFFRAYFRVQNIALENTPVFGYILSMKESRILEFKEKVTNTFLKTVSAFANYGGGKILFGIADDGSSRPLENPVKDCLAIENIINDSISPQPDYSLAVDEKKGLVSLTVEEGSAKPYLYKSKAYKRNDTSTIEVDSLEFTRLALAGRKQNYESLPSENQTLTFDILGERLKKAMGVESVDMDVLKTLSLYSQKNGFTIAAALLADENNFPGIDIAKFGESISIIKNRNCFEHVSVLESFEKSISFYKNFYQYEKIEGSFRTVVQTVPESAFREAVANALIHRTWDVNSQIRVLMFDDRIQVVSPGGLPSGLTESEYLHGKISALRNPVLANVFYRLGIVEIFGTGVLRIMESYRESVSKPKFEITENSISVELPVFYKSLDLTADENLVYAQLSKVIAKPISEIAKAVPFGKSKTGEILSLLAKKGLVKIFGNGRGTKYSL